MRDDDIFNTGWDPHTALLTCENNINQLIIAYNHHDKNISEIAKKYNHQQEVIKQLMFQNQKLNELVRMHKVELVKLNNDIDIIKNRQE